MLYSTINRCCSFELGRSHISRQLLNRVSLFARSLRVTATQGQGDEEREEHEDGARGTDSSGSSDGDVKDRLEAILRGSAQSDVLRQ